MNGKYNFKKAFYTFLCCVIILGCHFNNANEKSAPTVKNVQDKIASQFDFSQIDSVECVHFKKAKDQKETSSFVINDSFFINTIKNDLANASTPAEECTHEV